MGLELLNKSSAFCSCSYTATVWPSGCCTVILCICLARGHFRLDIMRLSHKSTILKFNCNKSSKKLNTIKAFIFFLFWQRLGTDEDVLVELLATRTNEEIEETRRVFEQGLKSLCHLFVGHSIGICLNSEFRDSARTIIRHTRGQ